MPKIDLCEITGCAQIQEIERRATDYAWMAGYTQYTPFHQRACGLMKAGSSFKVYCILRDHLKTDAKYMIPNIYHRGVQGETN
jgi:hypothetical protein